MAPLRELTPGERNQIIGAKRNGVKLTEIAQKLGKSYDTVRQTWQKRDKRPASQVSIPRSGRPRKASDDQTNRLYRQLRSDLSMTW